MTRNQALENIRVAGFEGDYKTALRIYVENRVSYSAFNEAFGRGEQQKQIHKHEYIDVNGRLICRRCAHKWSL